MSVQQLKPQDLLVALKLVAHPDDEWTYASLARSLHMSAAETHAAISRLKACRLFSVTSRRIAPKNLLELLVHGLWYVFPAEQGVPAKGIPTAWSTAPLSSRIARRAEDEVVWPSERGKVRGRAIAPLYRSAPEAAMEDPALHELLALADALRAGRPRERKLATDELTRRLVA